MTLKIKSITFFIFPILLSILFQIAYRIPNFNIFLIKYYGAFNQLIYSTLILIIFSAFLCRSFFITITLTVISLGITLLTTSYFELSSREVLLKTYQQNAEAYYDLDKVENYIQSIKLRISKSELQLDSSKNFWGGVKYYIPNSEIPDYIKKDFNHIGLSIENGKLKRIYFFFGKIKALCWQADLRSNPTRNNPYDISFSDNIRDSFYGYIR